MELVRPQDLLEKCRDRDVAVVPFRDRGDRWGWLVSVDGTDCVHLGRPAPIQAILRECGRAACWDLRELEESGLETVGPRTVDVQVLHGSRRLDEAIRAIDPVLRDSWRVRETRLRAHLRACRTARIDLDRHSLLEAIPPEVVRGELVVRAQATMALLSRPPPSDPGVLERWTGPDPGRGEWVQALALRQMERDGTFVDAARIRRLLDGPGAERLAPGTGTFLRACLNLEREGIARYRIGMNATRTGRYRIEGGLNVMGIPHGPARTAIVSRHRGGSIVSFDFNAIDYRCIIASVDDPDLRAYYEGQRDFHLRTAQMFFAEPDELRRRIVKYVTYVFLYGGSEDTLVRKTGLGLEKVRSVIARLGRKLVPVTRLKERLAAEGRRDGHVTTPGGRRVIVRPGDHDGAILGLYAQTYSSEVFGRALESAFGRFEGRKSKLMFPVHDELVLDLHPREDGLVGEAMALMEGVPGRKFVVNMRRGETYADCTD